MANSISVKLLLSTIRRLPPDAPVKNPKKWCLTQKEHWIGWLGEYGGPGAYGRQTGVERDAEYAYKHVVQPEWLLYLATASSVDSQLVAAANHAFEKRTSLMQAAGAIRTIIPWATVAVALWPGRADQQKY